MKIVDLKDYTLPLRTVFWGYHASGVETLSCLKKMNCLDVVGIVLPDNREHSSIDLIKNFSKSENINIFFPKKLNDTKFLEELTKLNPEVYVVDSYTKLIPSVCIELVKGLAFNLHPGILPQYRGAHVLNWAIINGETEAGLTLHFLDNNFDTGDIVACKKVAIGANETAFDLDQKLIKKIPDILNELESQIESKSISCNEQGEGVHYSARKPADGNLALFDNYLDKHNLIRGVSFPWPGAYVCKNNIKVLIWQTTITDSETSFNDNDFVVIKGIVHLSDINGRLLRVDLINDVNESEYQPINSQEILNHLEKNDIEVNKYEFA